jgi:hypothetical protein
MQNGGIFSAKNSLCRNISIASAFGLTFLAAAVLLFIIMGLVAPGSAPKGLGNHLLDAYGLLSLFIPAWFVW